MEAQFTRLRDETWGVKVWGGMVLPSPGDKIKVTKRDGTVQDVILGRRIELLQTGEAIHAIQKSASEAAQTRQMCAECGSARGTVMCSDSNGIRALCCSRCARVPAYERSFA